MVIWNNLQAYILCLCTDHIFNESIEYSSHAGSFMFYQWRPASIIETSWHGDAKMMGDSHAYYHLENTDVSNSKHNFS